MKVWRVSRERTKWIAAANGILVTSTHCHTHKHSHAPKILNWFRMATDGCWVIVIVYAFSNNSRWCSRETERHHQNSIEHTIQLRSTRNISFKMVHTRLNRQVSNRTRCPEHTTKRTAIDYLIRYYCSITAHKIESSTEKKTRRRWPISYWCRHWAVATNLRNAHPERHQGSELKMAQCVVQP